MNNTDFDEPASEATERNVKIGFYIAFLIIGFGGNSLVITVIAGKKKERTIYDLLILNLGISDFGFIVVLTPIRIYSYINKIHQNLYYCRLLTPLVTTFYFLSIFTIASMAIYRCRLITNPYRPKMRKRSAYIWITVIWFSSLIIVLPLSVVSKTNNGICYEDWPSINHRKAYTIALCILQFVIPLLIIGVAYVRIGIYLWQSTVPQSTLSTSNKKKAQKRRKENVEVIKTLAMIVILFAICLLPGQIGWLLLDFGGQKESDIVKEIFKFSDILDSLHACVNPIIYGLLTEQFRREYVRYFSYCFKCGTRQMIVTENDTCNAESTMNVLSPLPKKRNLTSGIGEVEIDATINSSESCESKDFLPGNPLA